MGRPGVCVGERQRWWHNQSGGGGGTGTQGSTETTKLAGGGSPAAFSMLEYWLLEDDVGHREFRRVYTSLPQTHSAISTASRLSTLAFHVSP
jgi:hypothetical protein